MIVLMFCIQLQLTLALFLLNILLKVWSLGKWVSIRRNNEWPILVVTFLLYDGLNYVMFRWRCCF